MLTADLKAPDIVVGRAVVDTLGASDRWLRRRIDTVRFVDELSITRQSTLDIDCTSMAALQDGLPLPPEYAAVPLMFLRKQLIVDCDLRGRHGEAIHIATRKHDSFLSMSRFMSLAEEKGINLDSDPVIREHVYRIVSDFPLGPPQNPLYEQPSWASDRSGWSNASWDLWESIVTDAELCQLLITLTYSFMLVAYVPVSPGITILKFECRQDLPDPHERWYERFPLRSGLPELRIRIPMPAADHGRSSHLRVVAPEGLALHRLSVKRLKRPVRDYSALGAFLVRTWRGWRTGLASAMSRAPWKRPSDAQAYSAARLLVASTRAQCQSLLTPDRAHVYIPEPVDGHLEARLSMHVPRSGFMRYVLVGTSVIFGTLIAGMFLVSTLRAHGNAGSTDGAVAVLLLAPSAFAAWIIRYGEHAVTSRLLLPIRSMLLLSMACTFVAASAVVLLDGDAHGGGVESDVWKACTLLAGILWLFVVRAYLRLGGEEANVRRQFMTTLAMPIDDVEEVETPSTYQW